MVNRTVQLRGGHAADDAHERLPAQRGEHGAVGVRFDAEDDDVAALGAEDVLVGEDGDEGVVGEFGRSAAPRCSGGGRRR